MTTTGPAEVSSSSPRSGCELFVYFYRQSPTELSNSGGTRSDSIDTSCGRLWGPDSFAFSSVSI